MFNGIIVPLDGSPLAESALPHALALADALRLPVTLIHVVPRGYHALDYELRYDAAGEAAALAHAARELESRACALAGPHRRIEAYTAAGDAAEEIVRYAERSDGRCIVMATHGAGGALHWVFGSVARKVLAAATVPTLVVRPSTVPQRPGEPAAIRKILVPLDGSDLAREALPVVKDLTKPLGAAVTLARIAPIPTGMYLDSPYAPMTVQPYLTEAIAAEREAATADLALVAGELREAGIAVTSVVRAGSPANELLDLLADGQYDLVVMSSHGRTGVKRWVLGSVAERLVEAARTPVFIVRAAAPSTSGA
jgi:nucleotide-binding universal stress UspA family protein